MAHPPAVTGQAPGPANGRRAAGEAPSDAGWLLGHRVAIPEPPTDYCDRPELTGRCAPTGRRTTLLVAPGGFGKTTVLAATCRRAAADGVPVAWLTLDPGDDAATLDAYLAFAFDRTGIDIPEALTAAAATARHPRTARVLQALEQRGAPCVLALDELERVADPGAVDLLAFLLRAAPPCLHLALACRDLPPRLDAAPAVFGVDAVFVTAADLAFSKSDVARFFALSLSRGELDNVHRESGGWPIALRIRRNRGPLSETGSRVARSVFERWIEGRFWDGIPEADRDHLLAAALFDWIDAELLDEVLGTDGLLSHLASLPALAGLFERAPGRRTVHRLHPLLREHAGKRLRRESPARHRELHRRLARALARRGHTVDAMRHAAAAGDSALAGAILAAAGGVRWWLREGAERLVAADRLLDDAVVAADPRLGLVRTVALAVSGRLPEARRAWAGSVSLTHPDRARLTVDRHLVRGALAMNGTEPVAGPEGAEYRATTRRLAGAPTVPAVLRGAMEYGLCFDANQRADFPAARTHGRRALRHIGGASTYLVASVLSQLGQAAMATGRVREARRRYATLSRTTRERFADYPRLVAIAEVLQRELDLERNRQRAPRDDDLRLARAITRGGAPFAPCAAAAELVLHHASGPGPQGAIDVLDGMWERAREAGLTMLERLLAAMRVAAQTGAGHTDEADATWRAAGLPATDAGCVQPDTQSWREMEAVACARLRLLARRGDIDAARRLADRVDYLAERRGLKRTRMRALALRVRLEHHAGARGATRAALLAYLDLYEDTDYARPIGRLRAAPALLGALLDAEPDGPRRRTTARLLKRIGDAGDDPAPGLTARQREILRRLAAHEQDKTIAHALGLSVDGVRYHLRAVFAKLGVRRRTEAVGRARTLGILPS